MTSMSDEEFIGHVTSGLARCNDVLGMGLDPESLIKTGSFKKNAK